MTKERTYRVIKSFEHSQTDERLRLTGFGCNRCDWTFKGSNIQKYHKALKAHGEHNSQLHSTDSSASITWIYASK